MLFMENLEFRSLEKIWDYGAIRVEYVAIEAKMCNGRHTLTCHGRQIYDMGLCHEVEYVFVVSLRRISVVEGGYSAVEGEYVP